MAKKTYSLDITSCTTGSGSLDACVFGFDTDASGLQGALNANIPYDGSWAVTGTGPFTIEQPEDAGNLTLDFDAGDLDGSPSFGVTQEWIPTVSLSRTSASISEPDEVGYFIASIAALHTASITVGLGFSGSATIDVDYSASANSIVLNSGSDTSGSISIQVLSDEISESDENVIVGINSASNGEVGTPFSASITIQNSEPAEMPTLEITAPSGMTLTVDLYPYESNTAATTGVSLAEASQPCKYTANVANTITGWHHAVIFSGATPIGRENVYLDGELGAHQAGAYIAIQDPAGIITSGSGATAADVNSTIAQLLTDRGVTLDRMERLNQSVSQTLQGTAAPTNFGSLLISGAGKVTVVSNEDKTGYGLADGAITAAKIANNAIDAPGISSDGIVKIQGGIATTAQLNSSSGALLTAINSVGTKADLISTKADAILDDTGNAGVVLASSTDCYWAQVTLTVDSDDEWTVLWIKNGVPVTSGVTGTPTIRVIKRADGSDLVSLSNMSTIATGVYKYNEATNTVTLGEAVVVEVKATIGGSERTWRSVVTRDAATT